MLWVPSKATEVPQPPVATNRDTQAVLRPFADLPVVGPPSVAIPPLSHTVY